MRYLVKIISLAVMLSACGPAIAPVAPAVAPTAQIAAQPSYDYAGAPAQVEVRQPAAMDLCEAATCDTSSDLNHLSWVELGAAASILRGNLARGYYTNTAARSARARLHRIEALLVERSDRAHPRRKR